MRYRHRITDVVVSVRDDKELGPDWVPADGGPKRRRRSAPATATEPAPQEPATLEPSPAPVQDADTPESDTFVVSDHTVDDVLAFVGDDLERAADVLAAETAGKKPRSSLVKKLEALTADGD